MDKEKIIAQCVKEYNHAIDYRRKRETRWRSVDEFYNGKKRPSLVTKANVHIPVLKGGVDTFISKIDEPPYIAFEAQRVQDERAVEYTQSSMDLDYINNDWELVDTAGKTIATKYGRCIYKKFATNEKSFKDYFFELDVLDFYIDPMAGGSDPMGRAKYMGHDNIVKSIFELRGSKYDEEAVESIAQKLTDDSQVDNKNMSRQSRRSTLNLSEAVLTSEDSIKLTEHYTTYEGKRYKVLLSIEHQEAIIIEELEKLSKGADWPFATYAIFPDPLEFWTPGVGELLLEPNMVQNTLMSQMLDNITNRNYSMMAYDATKIKNRKDIRFRPNGRIAINGDPSKAIQNLTPVDISPAIQLFNNYTASIDTETGVNRNAKGAPVSKRMSATEFAGLIEQTAERFLSANRTYKACMRRVAKLYRQGLITHLDASRAISVLGPDGGKQWVKMTKDDIATDAHFTIKIQTGALAENASMAEKERRLGFVTRNRENQRVNQVMLDEVEALASGFSREDLPRLMNPELEGSWDIISDAHAENEELLKRKVEPNRAATTGHVQIHMNYAKRTPGLTAKQRERIIKHAEEELEYAAQNEEDNVREAQQRQRARGIQSAGMGMEGEAPIQAPPPAMAVMDAIEQNPNPLVDENII